MQQTLSLLSLSLLTIILIILITTLAIMSSSSAAKKKRQKAKKAAEKAQLAAEKLLVTIANHHDDPLTHYFSAFKSYKRTHNSTQTSTNLSLEYYNYPAISAPLIDWMLEITRVNMKSLYDKARGW
jgi:uncharacterized protein (UPF0333 family)